MQGLNLMSGFLTVVFVVALLFGGIVYGVTKFFQKKEIMVSKPIVPEMMLTTDGKKIDTIYVYRIK